MKKKGHFFYLSHILFVFLSSMIFISTQSMNKDLKMLSRTLTTIEDKMQQITSQVIEQESDSIHSDGMDILNTEMAQEEVRRNSEKDNLLVKDPYFTDVLPTLLPKDFAPQGTYSLLSRGKPEHLHPFGLFSDVTDFYAMCVPSLAHLHKGKSDLFAPAVAEKIEEVIPQDDSTAREYHIHLNKEVFWAPLRPEAFPHADLASMFLEKHPVTAHDFKFKYDVIMNPYMGDTGAVTQRSYYANISSFKVIDDYTFIVRWESQETVDEGGLPVKKIPYHAKETTFAMKPLPSFVYQYFADGTKILEDEENYRENSVWVQNFANHWARQYIVSCGPWLFYSFSDKEIEFIRNPHYFDQLQALTARRIYHIKDNPESAFQDFKMGKIDKMLLPNNDSESLAKFLQSSEYKSQASRNERIKQITSFLRAYTYIAWNMHTKFFESQKVRQAMSLAIDKEGIISGILNNAGALISGPFPTESYAYDKTIKNWPFDLEEASKLLDEAGWIDLNGDGIRDKVIDGKRVPFRFRMTYYLGPNPVPKIMAEKIAMSLREIGVLCEPYGVGRTDLAALVDDRTYDAVIMGWRLGLSPPDPRLLWHSEGAHQKGSLNYVGFSNKEADKLIELLSYETSLLVRQRCYHRLHRIIFEESPYTFVSKKTIPMVYREYVKNIFVPSEHQEWIPGATDDEVDDSVVWIEKD